jgi:hypothetical protein
MKTLSFEQMESRKLSLEEMVMIEGGGSINACDIALGLAVGIWGAALSAASFGLAAFVVGYGGGLLVSYVCHANE